MRSITKHDILRAWVEREVIDLTIRVNLFDEKTGEQTSGTTALDLAAKTVIAKIYDESGTEVLDFLYEGVDNDDISVDETATESNVVLHFTKNSYGTGNMTVGTDAEKWFELELSYADDPTNLFKNVFPYVSKEGTEMHFWIKLLRNRVN